jgi:predicted phage tail protein
MRTITLHGLAGDLFGREFRLDVASPAEALRALFALRPGLRAFVRERAWRVAVGRPDDTIKADYLTMHAGALPLHFIPATMPAGDQGGIGKIILGVVLIGAAIAFAPAGAGLFGAALGASTGFMGVTFGNIAMLGVSMLFSGVAGLLAGSPQAINSANAPEQQARPEDRPSFMFNGVTNNSQQGGPVPIVYGEHLVGSVVIYGGIAAEDIAI